MPDTLEAVLHDNTAIPPSVQGAGRSVLLPVRLEPYSAVGSRDHAAVGRGPPAGAEPGSRSLPLASRHRGGLRGPPDGTPRAGHPDPGQHSGRPAGDRGRGRRRYLRLLRVRGRRWPGCSWPSRTERLWRWRWWASASRRPLQEHALRDTVGAQDGRPRPPSASRPTSRLMPPGLTSARLNPATGTLSRSRRQRRRPGNSSPCMRRSKASTTLR